ncbi:MAG TPA: VOC family protein [Pyrinomonadaceae bacterium]|nr:VOC family protein [Pyrinomonadaceae bacterium]
MATINPYLTFRGNCEEAFEFYRSQFGGEFAVMMRMNEIDCGAPVPADAENLIMHIALPIKGNMLMGGDAPEGMGPQFVAGNNYSVSISADSEEEGRRLFDGLSAGGNVMMPFADAFWGGLFGMFTDKFGVRWTVAFDKRQQPA